MRELALLTFVTVDGVMQSPHDNDEDPSNGFTSGGWARPCWDPVMAQVATEAMADPYELLLGRRTYDSFTLAHTAPGDSDDDPMTLATKYVVTSTPETLTWQNSVAITGDVAKEIAELKAQDGPLLQVHGSWQLIQTLLASNLVDEFRLWTFPVILGEGKRLFANNTPIGLQLRKTAPAGDSGAVMTIYRPTTM